jgi:hypothetical protein
MADTAHLCTHHEGVVAVVVRFDDLRQLLKANILRLANEKFQVKIRQHVFAFACRQEARQKSRQNGAKF